MQMRQSKNKAILGITNIKSKNSKIIYQKNPLDFLNIISYLSGNL